MTEVIVWSGWIGGIAVGLYALFQLIVSGKLLGVSTGFGNVCSYISKASFFKEGEYTKPGNWRLWFLIGLPLGGIIAALTSPGAVTLSFNLGTLYESVMPNALWMKALVLFGGGIMIGYGARLAGGCTSGHSIAGISLMNPPSILASAGFFAGGILMVQSLFYFFG
jgi:hypothetical protein